MPPVNLRLSIPAARGARRQVQLNNAREATGFFFSAICIFLAYLRIQGRGAVIQSETEEKADVTHSCCMAVSYLKSDYFVHCWSINAAGTQLLAVTQARL